MFYYLNGSLELCEANTAVIDCGGVGYKLTITLNTANMLASKLNQKVKLYTHLAVREDGIELFGFGSNEERSCFNQLTTVSGVGPKAAISILSTLAPDKLTLAIATEDIKAISKASGIGPKIAARVVLELKGKISKEMMTAATADTQLTAADMPQSSALSEASEALMVLGYDKNTVLSALRGIDVKNKDVGEVIKLALKKLSK